MIEASLLENASDFIYFLGFAFVMLSKISLPYYFGQRVLSEGDELVNAAYNSPWYEQNTKHRKQLVTIMMNEQRGMKINVMDFFVLDLNNLGSVAGNESSAQSIDLFSLTFRSFKLRIHFTLFCDQSKINDRVDQLGLQLG